MLLSYVYIDYVYGYVGVYGWGQAGIHVYALYQCSIVMFCTASIVGESRSLRADVHKSVNF